MTHYLQNSKTLLHSSKRIYTFTKSLKKIVENKLGNFIDEVSKPHLSLYYLKLKKILECLNLGITTFKAYNPVRKCMF